MCTLELADVHKQFHERFNSPTHVLRLLVVQKSTNVQNLANGHLQTFKKMFNHWYMNLCTCTMTWRTLLPVSRTILSSTMILSMEETMAVIPIGEILFLILALGRKQSLSCFGPITTHGILTPEHWDLAISVPTDDSKNMGKMVFMNNCIPMYTYTIILSLSTVIGLLQSYSYKEPIQLIITLQYWEWTHCDQSLLIPRIYVYFCKAMLSIQINVQHNEQWRKG